jgi:hypothetical protein
MIARDVVVQIFTVCNYKSCGKQSDDCKVIVCIIVDCILNVVAKELASMIGSTKMVTAG